MLTKLNVTAFASDSLASKILKAVDDVLTTGAEQYLENRNRKRWLRVDIKEQGGKQNLQFLAYNGQEVGDIIAQSSWFHWSRPLEIRFAALLKAVYELLEHPAVTIEKREAWKKEQVERAAVRLERERTARVNTAAKRVRLHARAKQMGATHIIRTGAGKYFFASFKKSLFGFGKTVITVYPKDGEIAVKRNGGGKLKTIEAVPYKLSPEASQYVTLIGVLK
ncbi:hypothetical protein [Pseudomonas weihenstephanensis]|uniref:hypothetical protein n=1 Tax=Pseudomonas weihenstephanensis TaxID=1608994 RepID=UPI00193BEC57|nr:hypothetical protein [Pseudomonas weihenstephanensis]MBM1189377.1 hypothetical protein [Pseudomonas weihenstephanensis]